MAKGRIPRFEGMNHDGQGLSTALGRGGVGNPGVSNLQNALARRESGLREGPGDNAIMGALGRKSRKK